MRSDDIRKYGGVYFVTSREFGVGHAEGAQEALKGGVRIIQYREKQADTWTMVSEALKIKQLCKKYGALFIIDDRIDIALAVDSDGVHLGDDDMPIKIAKKILPGKIIGVSARTPKEAKEAERGGASYLGVGAIFPTNSKANAVVIGMDGFRKVRNSTKLPVYGIGGLKLGNIKELKGYGADGIAVISAILAQDDRTRAAGDLVKEWKKEKK